MKVTDLVFIVAVFMGILHSFYYQRFTSRVKNKYPQIWDSLSAKRFLWFNLDNFSHLEGNYFKIIKYIFSDVEKINELSAYKRRVKISFILFISILILAIIVSFF